MRLLLLRAFRGFDRGDVVDVAPAAAEVWLADRIAEPAPPPVPPETPDEEDTAVQIRILVPIHGPIGSYDAGDEIDVVEHFAEAWIAAGIAELSGVRAEDAADPDGDEGGEPAPEPVPPVAATVTPPRVAALPAAKGRGGQRRTAQG